MMKRKLFRATLVLLLSVLLPLGLRAEIITGSCGECAEYSLDTSTGVMEITGSGAMGNYRADVYAPWYYQSVLITSVSIAEGITSIGDYAFLECSSLTSITIPESVTSIGFSAFYGCSSLTSVSIPEGVTSIGRRAFEGCSSLTSISIPEGVTSIEEAAFADCSSLTSIIIPEGVTGIGGYAFYECRSLTSINIPESVTSIGDFAFRGCCFLSSSFINHSSCTSMNNWGAAIADQELENGLLIKDNVVVGCRGWVNSVVVPEGITSIGDYAFYDCSSLASITIPEGVTGIGDYAFYSCSSLTSITIPESVTSIGDRAFEGCRSLTSITIPEGVTNIAFCVFQGCSSLTSISIPEGVTSIEGSAFVGCYSLTSITIPEGVTSIEGSAFAGCSSLTSIIIPEGVTSIGDYAFHNCSSLTSITIPESVTSIGGSAFWGCRSLTSITIPESVTSIGGSAFWGCSSLASITIPEGVTSIGGSAFNSCRSLTSITIPESVTGIGNYAFESCESLTSINIPESVASIGNYAFENCRSLTSINIPESVTSIGIAAFHSCYKLSRVICKNSVPLFIDADCFSGSHDVTLYVPFDAVETYENVAVWRDFRVVGLNISDNGIGYIDNNLVLRPGLSEELLAVDFRAGTANAGFAWATDYEDIATVDENGFVTAHGVGTATITATTKDEEGVSFCFTVNVVESGTNTIYTKDVIVSKANNSKFPIYIDNAEQICNVQFDIEVPFNSRISVTKGTDRITDELDHNITCENIEGNCYRITVISSTNSYISDKDANGMDCRNTSPLLEISLNFDWTPSADYDIILKNIVMSSYNDGDGQTTKYTCGTRTVKITVPNVYGLGYVSSNSNYGTVSVAGENIYIGNNWCNADENTNVTFSATPKTGYGFSCWMRGEEEYSTENPLTVSVTENLDLTAVFVPNKYNVKFVAEGQVVYEEQLDYKSTIVIPEAPEKEGYLYIWGEVPATVPANDVEVVADYFLIGDVFEDDELDVADVTQLVGIVSHNTTLSDRDKMKADVYADKSIDVADVTSLIPLVLAYNPSSRTADGHLFPAMYGSSAMMFKAETYRPSDNKVKLAIGLDNATLGVQALQFDLHPCEGMTLSSVALNTEAFPTHLLQSKRLSDGSLRVVIYSMTNEIMGVDGVALLDAYCDVAWGVQPNGDVLISNAVVVDADGDKVRVKNTVLSDMTESVRTASQHALYINSDSGYLSVSSDIEDHVVVYNLSGNKLYEGTVSPTKSVKILAPEGTYLVNGRKVVVK